jgi:hypothetical protein
MKPAADGSLTIYLQNDSPGQDKESNWLPSPAKGKFKMALRLYAPKRNVVDGSWVPSAVKKVA